MLRFERIEDKMERYSAYTKALSWDKNNTFCLDKHIGIEWLLDKMIGVYDNGELIGFGSITPLFDDEYKKSIGSLSMIIRKDYRGQGISELLIKHMLDYCKDLNIKLVTAEILKTNKTSINNARYNDFSFVKEEKNVLFYEKKLINK